MSSVVEGFGFYGTSAPDDPNGAVANARMAMDEGRYERVGPGENAGDDQRLIDIMCMCTFQLSLCENTAVDEKIAHHNDGTSDATCDWSEPGTRGVVSRAT